MTKTAELSFLFRTLKAPAAARALPKLAERARQEEWSYESSARISVYLTGSSDGVGTIAA